MSISTTNWVFRLGFAGALLYQSYSIMRDDQAVNKRNINQALGYYHDNFQFLSELRNNKPEFYGELDSLIQSTLSVLALWAGVAIILGSKFMGGILALIHSLLTILFTSNVWTPKVDTDEQMTHTLMAFAQLIGSFIMLFSAKPDVPAISFKNE